MDGIIAKKYVNALMKSCHDSEIDELERSLDEITTAFNSTKFNNIILSADLSIEQKEGFVLSLVDIKAKKSLNFFKLLAEKNRLDLIPSIAKELKYQTSLKSNSYEGDVISNFEISDEHISKLEESFSKKFSATVKLSSVLSDYPGVKVELDDLGVEVSFSLERLKAQMTEHILKAI